MHEFSVMEQVVGVALAEAKARKASEVHEVVLDVGSLTFLAPEQLEFAYETLAKGTALEGSRLSINIVEPEVTCAGCGYAGAIQYREEAAFHVRVPSLSCPKCGGRAEVARGLECCVRTIRMEVEEAGDVRA